MKKLWIEPTPLGWAYGFPRLVPDDAWYMDGKEPRFREDQFDVNEWMVQQGYPRKLLEQNKLRKYLR